jgi:hypothetical protein
MSSNILHNVLSSSTINVLILSSFITGLLFIAPAPYKKSSSEPGTQSNLIVEKNLLNNTHGMLTTAVIMTCQPQPFCLASLGVLDTLPVSELQLFIIGP